MIGAVTLAACPTGLFWFGDTLCLKTEYGSNEGRIDAYIVSSGEFFWGAAPQTIASQRAQVVIPIANPEAALRAPAPLLDHALTLDRAASVAAALAVQAAAELLRYADEGAAGASFAFDEEVPGKLAEALFHALAIEEAEDAPDLLEDEDRAQIAALGAALEPFIAARAS